jgi:release factor glutamine methyltransferase
MIFNEDLPKEYKKGKINFLGCKIDLRKKVFIPRAETKFWVKKALKECKLKIKNWRLKKPKFLDIFAGSGFIGIAILKNIKNSYVDFVDIDKKAIEQIKINLRLNKISENRYKIYQSNLFEKIKNKKYNFIFANPPYVAKERINEVQKSVLLYEPRISIFGGKDGLFLIRKFLNESKNHLRKKGLIFMEFDPLQKEEIKKILEKLNFKSFSFFKDQFKSFRFLLAKK